MSLHHQNWMDWIWNQSSSKWTQEQAEATIVLMAIFYFHKNSMNFFFFFLDHRMQETSLLGEIHQMEALSQGISESINVAQMGSGITLYQLSSHSWQPWRPSQPAFHWCFISYRNCISEHVLKGNVVSLSPQGPRQHWMNQFVVSHGPSFIQAQFPLQLILSWRSLWKDYEHSTLLNHKNSAHP